jgi:hypothetical protein
VIGGDRAGEVTGGDEESDGRARVASRRAMREKERECAADGWGRPVSGGGCAGGCTGNGPRGPGGERGTRGRGEKVGPDSAQPGGEIFLFLFLFLFSISFISFFF